jgi:hypothetical protein
MWLQKILCKNDEIFKKPNYYKNQILVPMDKATSYTNWWANHCTVRLTVLPYFVFEKKKRFYRGALVRMIKHKIRLKIKRAHTFQMHHQRERLRGAKGHHSNGKEIIYCTYDIIKVGECKSTETWHDRKESNWIAESNDFFSFTFNFLFFLMFLFSFMVADRELIGISNYFKMRQTKKKYYYGRTFDTR